MRVCVHVPDRDTERERLINGPRDISKEGPQDTLTGMAPPNRGRPGKSIKNMII